MMPDTAIIVPIYNTKQYLNKCIDSILCQKNCSFFLVLVDDGSTDGCAEICDRYADDYNYIHVIHKINGGLSDARNAGIEWAVNNSIKWISFIDSDDYVDENYIYHLRELAHRYNTKCAVAGFSQIFTENEDFSDTFSDTTPSNTKDFKIATDKAFCYPYFNADHPYSLTCAWGKIFHIDLFDDVRFPVGKIMEDRFTTHKLLFKCPEIAISTAPLYKYVQTKDSIMRSDFNSKKMDFIDAFNTQIQYFKENNYICAYRQSIQEYIGYFNRILDEIYMSQYASKYYRTETLEFLRVLFKYHELIETKQIIKYICYCIFPITRKLKIPLKKIHQVSFTLIT